MRVEADEIVLVLTNAARNGNMAAPSGSGGSGIAGMRERAELVSGNLSAGPVASGWAVECRLPAAPTDPATTP